MITIMWYSLINTYFEQEKRPLNTILPTDTLESIWNEIPYLDNNSLVIFDRDDTLLRSIDSLCPEDRIEFSKLWKEVYTTEKTDEEREQFLKTINTVQPSLIDHDSPRLIKTLQEKRIPTLMVTGAFHGKNNIGFVQDLCIAHLKQAGINLKTSFEQIESFLLDTGENIEVLPLFMDGIIFSSSSTKGKALETFLNKISWQPNKIIFIDDKMHYLQSVQQSAHQLDIPFLGLHYRRAYKLPRPNLQELVVNMHYFVMRDILTQVKQ